MKVESPTPRKIYTKVVFDMNTWETLEEESFNYGGRMALCDGEGEGEGGSSWIDSLPEDVRGWDETKNSDSPEKFWDQMVNMRSRMGQSIRIPSEDAGDEDRAAFQKKIMEKVPTLMQTPNFDDDETLSDLYAKMGRPAEAKDYTAPEFKDSKGNVIKGAGAKLAEAFKETAYKMGLSQKKYEEALSSVLAPSIGAHEQATQARQEEKAKLAEAWGTAHDRNSTVVSNFLKHTEAPKGILDALEAGTVDSATMMWIHSMASKTVGKQGSFQNDDSNSGVMTPDEAALKISEIRNNPKHAYYNKMDPGNAAARKYVRELYLLKNPKTGTASAPGTQFNIGGNVDL